MDNQKYINKFNNTIKINKQEFRGFKPNEFISRRFIWCIRLILNI